MKIAKNINPLIIFLVASLAVLAVVPVSAGVSTTASVPVTLTVSNDYRAVNVTLPASLPVEVINGTVITATDAKITNNSQSSGVRVSEITVTDGAYRVGDYDRFEGRRTIALKINGVTTAGSGKMDISSSSFPEIMPGESLGLKYFAKVSNDGENVNEKEAAHVVFTVTSCS